MSFLLFLLCLLRCSANDYLSSLRTDNDGYGTRFAVNDVSVIVAQNDYLRYQFHLPPFGTERYCVCEYPTDETFVLNVATGSRQNNTTLFLVYLRTNESDADVLELGTLSINQSACLSDRLIYSWKDTVVQQFNHSSYEISLLTVDFDGQYAFGFLRDFAYVFDIARSRVSTLDWWQILPNVPSFYAKDAETSVTSDGVKVLLLVGYFQVAFDATLPAVYLLRFEAPSNLIVVDDLTLISGLKVGGSFAFNYNFNYVMSISIQHATQQALIALPSYSQTFLIQFTSQRITLVNRVFHRAARSVAWLGPTGQAAFLLADSPTPPWALSQLQVIDTSLENTDLATLYALPNNQQTLTFLTPTPTTSFLRVKVSDGRPVILTNDASLIYAPISPAGFFFPLSETSLNLSAPQPCPPGTFKNQSAPSPCLVCPTGYRSSASVDRGRACVPCSGSSYCPLAAVSEVNKSFYPSRSQAIPYPNSPVTTNFDDILITNTFRLRSSDGRCLVVSPLFWTLLALGLVFVVLLLMTGLYWLPGTRTHFHFLTRVFRRTDLIGEGDLWVGGLTSFALLVLITFAFWFGSVYVRQYPIETAGDATFSCDPSLRNAKFTSSLQLLALLRADEEQLIFDLLEDQNWTMTVDFIQTGFQCPEISVQGIIESYRLTLPGSRCFQQRDSSTQTWIVPLPLHTIDVQFNLSGSSSSLSLRWSRCLRFLGNAYVGALRVCLNGSAILANGSSSSVKELFFCQLISSRDQTMSQTTNVHVDLTKSINRTEGLQTSASVSYSGIWIPTLTVKSVNDRLIYEQQGAYLRYLAGQQVVLVSLSETPFFIKNTQEPIARSGEILFHNVLFSTVCIELFALAFLLFKLALLPVFRWILLTICCRRPGHPNGNQQF